MNDKEQIETKLTKNQIWTIQSLLFTRRYNNNKHHINNNDILYKINIQIFKQPQQLKEGHKQDIPVWLPGKYWYFIYHMINDEINSSNKDFDKQSLTILYDRLKKQLPKDHITAPKPINIRKIFARNLKYLIKSRKINNIQFSKDVKFKYGVIEQWISMHSFPRTEALETIASYFGLTPAQMIEPLDRNVDLGQLFNGNHNFTYNGLRISDKGIKAMNYLAKLFRE